MSFGINIYSASGGVQLNADDPHYMASISGSVTLDSNMAGTISVPAGVTAPLLFVSAANYVCLANFSNNTMHLRGVAGTVVNYKLFIAASEMSPTNTGYGMEVYNASGALIYSTEKRPLHLIHVGTATRSSGGFTYNHGIPGGYVLISPFTFSRWQVIQEFPYPFSRLFFFGVKTSGSNVIAAHAEGGGMSMRVNAPDPYDNISIPIIVVAP